MKYPDGKEMKAGDKVLISGRDHGVVVTNIDDPECSEGKDWSYLGSGVMIDTDFGGLVHYQKESLLGEEIILIE